jgi:hypothetical protein
MGNPPSSFTPIAAGPPSNQVIVAPPLAPTRFRAMLKAEKPMPHARSALVSALLTLAAPMLRAEVLVLSDIPLSGDQSVPSVPDPRPRHGHSHP